MRFKKVKLASNPQRNIEIYFFCHICLSSCSSRSWELCLLRRGNTKDAAKDSVISILLHFIMPLSIISTDYMQLDLLYSFFIVCMDRHKKIQVTNTQIYVCVFIQHEGKGSDWHYMATRGGGSESWAPLSV